MPAVAKNINVRPLKWLSKDWNLMIKEAAKEAKRNGMITDMIVGSGWPFGGELLKEQEMTERIITNNISYSGASEINLTLTQLIDKALEQTEREKEGEAKNNELFFVKLVPVPLKSVNDIVDITGQVRNSRKLIYR